MTVCRSHPGGATSWRSHVSWWIQAEPARTAQPCTIRILSVNRRSGTRSALSLIRGLCDHANQLGLDVLRSTNAGHRRTGWLGYFTSRGSWGARSQSRKREPLPEVITLIQPHRSQRLTVIIVEVQFWVDKMQRYEKSGRGGSLPVNDGHDFGAAKPPGAEARSQTKPFSTRPRERLR